MTRAVASGEARYASERDRAGADEMVIEPEAGTLLLTGEGPEGAFVSSEGATIAGPQLQLDRAARLVECFGPGTFDLAGDDAPVAHARWSRHMRFDDLAGVLAASGEVSATHTPDEWSVDRIDAETVSLEITPASPGEQFADPFSPAGPDAQEPARERKILRARAQGSAHVLGSRPGSGEPTSSALARVESRRYEPTPDMPPGATPVGPRVLSRVTYLDAPEVVADEVTGELRAPGSIAADAALSGRLLVVDRRASDAPAEAGSRDSPRGSSLFTWKGDMTLRRDTREVRMERDVHLVHERLGDARRTELECETLTARFAEAAPEPRGSPRPRWGGGGDLEAVDAQGAVWLRSGTKELVAERAWYDAVAGRATITASPGDAVTLFDTSVGAPVSAAELLWDLRTDAVTIRRPAPVTAPR